MSPVGLKALLHDLGNINNENVLVGMETADDAGVYALSDQLALVQTADYITPPTDDPYLFGQVAATNALNDVYAMGGKPISALNLVNFPAEQLPLSQLKSILAGALSKIEETGAVLLGGHSVEDEEPKFGLAVTGLVHPEKIWRNNGAKVGDVLVCSKPIGSGVLFNANLVGKVPKAQLAQCMNHVTTLNKSAWEVMRDYTIHACTDITGFGLVGHAFEMAEGSDVALQIDWNAVPKMEGALEMLQQGIRTQSTAANLAWIATQLDTGRLSTAEQALLADPQTAGGMLAAVPPEEGERLVQALQQKGLTYAVVIGKVMATDGTQKRLQMV